MDYKKESTKILSDLKKKNHSRRKIEKHFGYANKYIDQILSKGGNESVYYKLKEYKELVDKGVLVNFSTEDEQVEYLKKTKHINPERALIDMLILEVAKMKSKLYGMSVDDAILELEQNASLALRQVEKGSGK